MSANDDDYVYLSDPPASDFSGAEEYEEDDLWPDSGDEGKAPQAAASHIEPPPSTVMSSTGVVIHQGTAASSNSAGSAVQVERPNEFVYRYRDPHPWPVSPGEDVNLSDAKWTREGCDSFAVLSVGPHRCLDGKYRVALGLSTFGSHYDKAKDGLIEFLIDGHTTQGRPMPSLQATDITLRTHLVQYMDTLRKDMDENQTYYQDLYRLVGDENNLDYHPLDFTARVITETLKRNSQWLQGLVKTSTRRFIEHHSLESTSDQERIRILPSALLHDLASQRGVRSEHLFG
ncbi:hypothetical protein JCM24511_01213 [Saitozyma sp. JCM 24511]|nr:hypothetical protein JCM24511_01213 [Saitozyma sp. JCM 24511]